jgi:hypothetical protein
MLGIFEQCKAEQGSWRLLADGLLSAAKQQIQYLSTSVPKGAPLYSEVDVSANLARMLGVVAVGAALITGALVGREPEAPESWTVHRPEALFWFPVIPEGRYCSDAPERAVKPERILTTGVLVRGNPEAPEYWTVVRSKTRFWISTTAWGLYCFDTPERAGSPENILIAQVGRRDRSRSNDPGTTAN